MDAEEDALQDGGLGVALGDGENSDLRRASTASPTSATPRRDLREKRGLREHPGWIPHARRRIGEEGKAWRDDILHRCPWHDDGENGRRMERWGLSSRKVENEWEE